MADTLTLLDPETPDPNATPPAGVTGDDKRVNVAPGTGDTEKTPETETRPEWLPEKFKNTEDLATAYAALEAKMSKGETTPPKVGDSEPDGSSPPLMDMEALALEAAANGGKLSDATYEKFATSGFGKDLVDNFVASQAVQGEEARTRLVGLVGGDEAFNQIREWAKSTLSAEQVSAFDRAVTSGDEALAGMAIRGLKADFVSANGKEPDLVVGESRARGGGPKPFASNAQVTQAMSDPRYRSDPAYRATVVERLRVSEF